MVSPGTKSDTDGAFKQENEVNDCCDDELPEDVVVAMEANVQLTTVNAQTAAFK
ncbi:hypothetical protein G3U99_12395 [Vibrio coralliilyticus OCN008]|uniref:hypothetical protein n=1 Tax=Vibrio TaxID=662 RepID=UPI000390F50B|nr:MULTISPECIES: hypothetical protein [Vibrio]ERB63059.1 hypothetical protein N779_22980 [Vibrio coralliilyticus OCN008]QIJ82787.1 hypothetical protein G3U99_12395 [Vibrio coralliilyticus OCN008]